MASKEIDYLASQYTATIRDAILQSYEWFLREVPERQIVDAIKSNGIQGLVDLTDEVSTEMANQITPILTDAWRDAGRTAISGLPTAMIVTPIAFDSLPINALTMAEEHRAAFVTNITESARDAVVTAVSDSIITGENPRITSIRFREAVGLTPRQVHALDHFRQGMENLDSDILDMELRDHRFDSTLRQHLQEGEPFEEEYIDRVVERYRQRQLKWRADTIGRTEAMRAIHMGEYEALNAALLRGDNPELNRTRRYWNHAVDERVRAEHRRIPMMNPHGRGINEPFDSPLGPIRYPGDPNAHPRNTINCRCSIQYNYMPKYENMTYEEVGIQTESRAPYAADVTGQQAYTLYQNRGDLEAVENLESLLERQRWRLQNNPASQSAYWQHQIDATEDWLERIYNLMRERGDR